MDDVCAVLTRFIDHPQTRVMLANAEIIIPLGKKLNRLVNEKISEAKK